MSRINVAALQSRGKEIPEFEILPDSYQEQQQAPEEKVQKLPDVTPHLERFGQQLEQLNSNNSNNQLLAQIGADPDLQQVLAARKAGKKVKIVEEDDSFLPPEEPADTTDWAALAADPVKMGQHLTRTISQQSTKALLPAMQKMMQQSMAPVQAMMQQIEQLNGIVNTMHQKTVQGDFERIRGYNPEQFDSLRPAMRQILQENPNMKLERVYKLARAEAGLPAAFDQTLSTERPTAISVGGASGDDNPHSHLGNIATPRGSVPQNTRISGQHFDQTLDKMLGGIDFRGLPGVR